MGKAEYFILIGGNETGPWTLGQVQAFWRAGAVTLETLYAQLGAAEWKPLSALLDVAPSAAPTPAPQSENSYADEQRKMIATVVNVMLPVDATKLRQWLRDKLTAIGFAPETDAIRESFESYLSHFSNDEQKQAFGEENLTAYRRGKIKAAQLIGKTDNLITLQQFRVTGPTLLDYDSDFDYESGAAEMGRSEGAAAGERIRQQRMDERMGKVTTNEVSDFTKEQARRGAEAANAITKERRRLRALGDMTTDPFSEEAMNK
jgi:hypothetical protein